LNLLVTGGAGYIGGVAAALLRRAGHRTIIYDNLSRGHREAIQDGELIVGDLADRSKLDFVFQNNRIDAVLHFAGVIEAGESMRVPEQYFRNNTMNTLNLLEVMLQNGVSRLVFSSTAALYGEPERIPICEDDPLRPANVYGESKLMIEQMLKWFHCVHRLRYASLRYFNAAGAYGGLGEAHDPESHLIPLVLKVALGQRDAISIFGTDYPTADGTCVRDYIHVLDLAGAHLLALTALNDRERVIYNLGNGRGFSVREVIDIARRVTGHPIPAIEAPRRTGDAAVLVANSERIRTELMWRPAYPHLEAIMASAWKWHSGHPNGYARE
jgi:UDP-glucose 4-epimerase